MTGTPQDGVPEAGEPSDVDLLRAHVSGDAEAFGLLFRRHRDRLWAVALRTMGDPDDAADGLQDAMVAAYRRAGTFRGDAAVTTWLHRVVVNACLDRLRASAVRRTEPLIDDLVEDAGHPALRSAASDAMDPADVVLVEEQRERIRAALATLPADQRVALVLVDMQGYPVAEVAVILGCPVGTVKSRCSRGRDRLAALLGVTDGNPGAAAPVLPTGPNASGAAREEGDDA